MKYRFLLFISLILYNYANCQNHSLDYTICTLDSIYFDSESSRGRNINDSALQAEKGLSKLYHKNPYLLELTIVKSFNNKKLSKKIKARTWQHEDPSSWIKKNTPFMFILTPSDSTEVFRIVSHFETFKLWNGKWAEPTGVRNITLNEPRKAIFGYDLLKRKNTRYYRVISQLLKCCEVELNKYYMTK